MRKNLINHTQKVVFNNEKSKEFLPTLHRRVDEYFITNKISKYANWEMYVHIGLTFFIFMTSYLLLMFNVFGFIGSMFLFCALGASLLLFGWLGHAFLHHSITPNAFMNRLAGAIADLIGNNEEMWVYRHNFLHHNYTNIGEVDEDISGSKTFLRRNFREPFLNHHRFQKYYWIVLYSFYWINVEVIEAFQFFWRKVKHDRIPVSRIISFVLLRLVHLAIFFVLPFVFIQLPAWQIALGELLMMLTVGLLFSVVTQLAHVVGDVEFPEMDSQNNIDENWAVHQMKTTSNFSTQSSLATYLCGGLNFQIEHHLLPNISYTHFKNLAPIVRDTAHEFGIPYIEFPSFFAALKSHYDLLKKMGEGPSSRAP